VYIKNIQERELKYYESLRLSKEAKKKIFDLVPEDRPEPQKLMVFHPFRGYLIMSEEEYKQFCANKQ